MAMTDTQWLRLFTTDDTDTLSDATIALILTQYASDEEWARRKLALADCKEYMARSDIYETQSRGGISVGRNRLIQEAKELRAEVGATVEEDTLSVLTFSDEDGEYA